MAFTEWRYKALIITRNKSVGDSMYEMLRAFPNDPLPEESVFDIELSDGAWATEYSVKLSVKEAIDSLSAGEYPALLQDNGMSNEDIDGIRSIITAECYDLHENDGAYTVKQEALDSFIAEQGYTRV